MSHKILPTLYIRKENIATGVLGRILIATTALESAVTWFRSVLAINIILENG